MNSIRQIAVLAGYCLLNLFSVILFTFTIKKAAAIYSRISIQGFYLKRPKSRGIIFVFRSAVCSTPGPEAQGRVRYGKLTLPPSDWSARTPLTQFASLIGHRRPPACGYFVCRGGKLRFSVSARPPGLVWASSSAHCSASRAPGISRVQAGRKHPKEKPPTPLSRVLSRTE